jgi:signal peptidase II
LKRYFRDYLLLLSVSGLIIILDQITKTIIIANLPFQGVWSPWDWLTPYARIVHWYNTGVAFGMFQNQNVLFSILSILVSLVILYYFPRVPRQDWSLRLAMGMQLGGALGNLIDRLRLGHVTDFISVGNFPVFNVADASISVGVVILILGVWIQDKNKKKAEEAEKTSSSHLDKSVSGEEISQ